MSNNLIEEYRDEAEAMIGPREVRSVPAQVLLAEAVELAAFVRRYWLPQAPAEGEPGRPGLSQVNGAEGQRLPPDIADQLLELVSACQAAQERYLHRIDRRQRQPMELARRTLRELKAALEYLFDDGGESLDHQACARFAGLYPGEPSSHDAMALALDSYSIFAERHRTALEGLGGFAAATIDKARRLAEELRWRSAPTERPSAKPLKLRNALRSLLHGRMRTVRAAARFVFRDHPKILREATSDYQRRRRAAARREDGVVVEPPPAGRSAMAG